jgi:hypothetical protein
MNTNTTELGNPDAAHLYEITALRITGFKMFLGGGLEARKSRFTIRVHANNRAVASKLAKRHGYEVEDVNMIG